MATTIDNNAADGKIGGTIDTEVNLLIHWYGPRPFRSLCVLFCEKSTKSAGGPRISPGPLKTLYLNGRCPDHWQICIPASLLDTALAGVSYILGNAIVTVVPLSTVLSIRIWA